MVVESSPREKKDKDVESSPQKKKKSLLFIILGVILLAIGGGGFFAYQKLLVKKHAATENVAAPGASDPTQHGGAPSNSPGVIYPMQPFIVNLADPQGKRYLKIKIELEIDSKEVADRLTKVDARLRDTVIMLLSSLTFEDIMTPEGKIRIRDELMDRFNQTIRPERINGIYFTELFVQ